MKSSLNIVDSGLRADLRGALNRFRFRNCSTAETMLLMMIPVIFLVLYVGVCRLFFHECVRFAEAALPLSSKIVSIGLSLAWPLIMLSSSIVSISVILSPHTRLAMTSPFAPGVFWLVFSRVLIRAGLVTGILALTAIISMTGPLSLPALTPVFMTAAIIPYIVSAVLAGLYTALWLGRHSNIRRARQTLLQLVLICGVILVATLRITTPEKLMQPSQFRDFERFVLSLSVPVSSIMPGEWVGQTILAAGGRNHLSAVRWLLTAWTITGLLAAAGFRLSRTFFTVWQKAQNHEEIKSGQSAKLFTSSISLLIARRDFILLLRDPVAATQTAMFVVLTGLYIFNITQIAIPDRIAFIAVCLFNSGFALAVASAICARYVFTSFSAEGAGLRLLLSSPVRRKKLFFARFMASGIPCIIFSALLSAGGWLAIMAANPSRVAGSEDILGMRNLTFLNLIAFAPAINIIAMHFGLIWLDTTERPAEAKAMSPGGIAYVMTVGSLIIFILGVQFVIPMLRTGQMAWGTGPVPSTLQVLLTCVPILSAGIYSLMSGLDRFERLQA